MADERERFVTLDSGKHDEFATGAKRDNHDDKPRFDLISALALERLAALYSRGAKKYGAMNWQKGIPYSRVYASLLRHIYAWRSGDRSEDHLAAVAWNAFALMHYEEAITRGELTAEAIDDLFSKRPGHEQQQ